jgi:hypothetical protein
VDVVATPAPASASVKEKRAPRYGVASTELDRPMLTAHAAPLSGSPVTWNMPSNTGADLEARLQAVSN